MRSYLLALVAAAVSLTLSTSAALACWGCSWGDPVAFGGASTYNDAFLSSGIGLTGAISGAESASGVQTHPRGAYAYGSEFGASGVIGIGRNSASGDIVQDGDVIANADDGRGRSSVATAGRFGVAGFDAEASGDVAVTGGMAAGMGSSEAAAVDQRGSRHDFEASQAEQHTVAVGMAAAADDRYAAANVETSAYSEAYAD
jgi:hypothetical protein